MIGWGTTSAASQTPLAIDDYVSRIQRARKLSDEAISSPSPSQMSRVRATLGLPISLRTPSGTLLIRRSAYLDSLTGSRADHFVLASRHLNTLEEQARAAGTPTSIPDRAIVENALDDAYEGITKQPSVWARIRRMIGQGINAILDLVQDASDALGLPATIAAVAGTLFISILFLRSSLRKRMVPDRLVRIKVGGQNETDWNAAAEDAIRRGEFDEAARARYRAIVAELVRLGVVRNTPSLTSGECRNAVRARRPDLSGGIDRATEVFEAATYGLVPVAKEDLRVLDAALSSFRTGRAHQHDRAGMPV